MNLEFAFGQLSMLEKEPVKMNIKVPQQNDKREWQNVRSAKERITNLDSSCAAIEGEPSPHQDTTFDVSVSCTEPETITSQDTTLDLNVSFSLPLLMHILAALHFNYNLRRKAKMNPDGTEKVKVSYPKYKNGKATVRNYVEELYQFYLKSSKVDLASAVDELKEMTTQSMVPMFDKQPKEAAVQKRSERKRMNIILIHSVG
ncbi:unnamed protein product [Porites lobata]|uniref:Uncharacterized protein n=1 Tax=Porites lobata TaxID=104759 RepID=A0ABN8QYT3_9CNID|nr:unnamed protein product [Porites lobata]